MKLKKTICPLLCAALFAGCSANNAGSSKDSASSLQPVSAAPAAQTTQDEMDAISSFSWKLFNQVRSDRESLVLSPLSAFFAMGMAANGASGATLAQIEEATGLKLADINRLSKSALEQSENDKASLHTANSAWISQFLAASVNPEFKSILEEDYDAPAKEVPFDEGTVKEVNDWVSEKTNGMIDQMVERFSNPSLVLINAISFDALWQTPYEDSALIDGMFTNADGKEEEVTLMQSTEDSYVSADQFEGFLKPYENGDYVFAALLPKEGTLEEALEKQDEKKLFEALNNPKTRTVHAAMPEFTLSTERTLDDALKALGMSDAFSDAADFSNISAESSFIISEVLQKAKIEVDAKGTKAAAATEVTVRETAALDDDSITLVCNRPYLYMILDAKTQTPVFIGTLQNISETSQS